MDGDDYANDNTFDNDDYDNSTSNNVELDVSEASLLDKLFSPRFYLDELEHKLSGEIKSDGKWIKVRKALASAEFISKALMNMNAIINDNTLMTKFVNEVDFYNILVENVVSFLQAALDEPTILSQDYFQVYLMYSNPLEMFAKLVIGGHAAEVVKQILTNTYKESPLADANSKKSFKLFS